MILEVEQTITTEVPHIDSIRERFLSPVRRAMITLQDTGKVTETFMFDDFVTMNTVVGVKLTKLEKWD